MGQALVGPPWALVGWALVCPLGPCGPGPCGPPLGPCGLGPWAPPWVLVGQAFALILVVSGACVEFQLRFRHL